MRKLLLLSAALLAVLASIAATPWPTDHGNNQRTGSYPTGTHFTHLTRAWARTLDGAVYGSPIYFGANIVVATENNTVYELNATTGALAWSHHLLAPLPTSPL